MSDWVDAEHRIERAQELCESKCWEEALSEIDQALSIHPTNSSWWCSRGFLLDQLGRHDEAIESYESALELNPNDLDIMMALGLNYALIGALVKAIEVFERLANLYPDCEPAFCHRIKIYADLGEHELAEEMFYLAQQLDEFCPHCFWHLGESLYACLEIQRAVYCWQQVLELDPLYRGARHRIADAYKRVGEFDKAEEYYLAEFRQDPSRTDLLLDLAEMLLQNGRSAEAIDRCRHAIDFDPLDVRAFVLLGDAYRDAGDESLALQAYESATGLDETLPGVQHKLGTVFMKLGYFPEARKALQAELGLQPSEPSTLMHAGNCALELGRPDEAAEYFERLVQVDDAVPGAHHNLAVCHFMRNRFEEGIRQCELALSLKDDYSLARHKLVLANMHLGRWSQAKRLLAEALTLDPENEALRKLQKRLPYRRLASWARQLTGTLKKLVTQTQNC